MKNSPSPASHNYFSQRLRLHYIDWGAPSDGDQTENMVLVHGIQDHCRTWDDLIEPFRNKYRVVAPDLRGHGDSEWVKGAAYQYLDYVYDLHQLIDQADLAPVTLVGHSMGGAIAALYAGIFPDNVKQLVVIEGIGLWHDDQPQPEVDELIRGWVDATRALSGRLPRRYPSLTEAYQRMQEANPQLTEAQALHLTIHGSNQNEDGSFSWKYDNYIFNFTSSSLQENDVTALWQKISAPTLILLAEHGLEHRIGHDGTEKYFAHHELVTIPGVGHWTYHDALDEVMGLMRNFLQV